MQRGSIEVLKHTMSLSRAKLEFDGPESFISLPSDIQQMSSHVLSTTGSDSSSACARMVELSKESEKARCQVKVGTDNTPEEVVKHEGAEERGGKSPSTVTESQSAGVTDVGPAEPAAANASDTHNIRDAAAAAAASTSSSCTVDDEASAKSTDDPSDRHDLEDKEMEKPRHTEDRSSPQGNDDVGISDLSQSDAAKRNTEDKAAVNSSSDGDTAVKCSDLEHITDHVYTSDQGPDVVNTAAGQAAIAEPSSEIINTSDVSFVHVDSESDEAGLSLEEASVLASNIPRGLDETVQMYLESERRGGGKILSFRYNERSASALVVFADSRGNFYNCLIL